MSRNNKLLLRKYSVASTVQFECQRVKTDLHRTLCHIFISQKLKYLRNGKTEKTIMQLPYFYEPLLQPGQESYTLSENTSKHCAQVLRMQSGSRLLLTDGKGLLAQATLAVPHKSRSLVKITHTEQKNYPVKKSCIAISLLKNTTRMDWFLEKATELGISEIIPMITDHTEKNISDRTGQRRYWRRR